MQISRFIIITISLAVTLATSATKVQALDATVAKDHALRLHERLTGVPPTPAVLATLTDLIAEGNIAHATFLVMENNYFYKELARSFGKFADIDEQAADVLNDFGAAVVGLTINNRRFDEIFYGDILYTSNDALMTYSNGTPLTSNNHINSPLIRLNSDNPPVGFVRPPFRCNGCCPEGQSCNPATATTDFRYDDNNHYEDLQNRFTDWPQRLVLRPQYASYQLLRDDQRLPQSAIMGLWSLRTAGREAFEAGTNRRIMRMFLRVLGFELEQLHDATRPDLYVRRDVDRQPGGLVSAYIDGCRGCHAGMDGLAQAFIHLDFNGGRLQYNATVANGAPNNNNKIYRQHNVYPEGHLAVNNQWVNLWTQGPNSSRLGWRTPQAITSDVNQGAGAAALAAVFAGTEAFGNNLAALVFKRICLREPTSMERGALNDKAREFEAGISDYSSYSASGPYNLRALHASVAEMCFGKVMP